MKISTLIENRRPQLKDATLATSSAAPRITQDASCEQLEAEFIHILQTSLRTVGQSWADNNPHVQQFQIRAEQDRRKKGMFIFIYIYSSHCVTISFSIGGKLQPGDAEVQIILPNMLPVAFDNDKSLLQTGNYGAAIK